MAHYLITGGAGFIGSHLVEELLQAEHRITVVDDFSTGRRENLPTNKELSIVAADLLTLTPNQLDGPFDAVVHLAALPSVTGCCRIDRNTRWSRAWLRFCDQPKAIEAHFSAVPR